MARENVHGRLSRGVSTSVKSPKRKGEESKKKKKRKKRERQIYIQPGYGTYSAKAHNCVPNIFKRGMERQIMQPGDMKTEG